MISLRNGTALAIFLSIAFVAIAVTMRDSLPGFSESSAGTTQLVGNELLLTPDSADTNGEGQIALTPNAGIDANVPTQVASWDDDSDGHDDSEGVDHHEDDEHSSYSDEHDDDDDDHDD